jgi:hypothetical protein
VAGQTKEKAPSWNQEGAVLKTVAVWTGLEPATSAVTGRHSNQLNYQTVYRSPEGQGLFRFGVTKVEQEKPVLQAWGPKKRVLGVLANVVGCFSGALILGGLAAGVWVYLCRPEFWRLVGR